MPFLSSSKTEDPKPEEKPPKRHKVPLTAAGMPFGKGIAGLVLDGQGVMS